MQQTHQVPVLLCFSAGTVFLSAACVCGCDHSSMYKHTWGWLALYVLLFGSWFVFEEYILHSRWGSVTWGSVTQGGGCVPASAVERLFDRTGCFGCYL